jgi:hypothetical protein
VDPRLTSRDGFKNFLYLAWKCLGLPEPTPIQYDIADYIANGPRRCMVQAFRGVGKSYIASAYVIWQALAGSSDHQFLVVSASKQRADDFSTFTMRLMQEMGDITAHLLPREGQRDSKVAFDFGPAAPSHAPSVTSRGVFSAITGQRADTIIPDDVESWNNSMTASMRDKLSETIKEYDAVIKPGGRIIFLGTPQSEQSIYRELVRRGFDIRVWPAQVPQTKLLSGYGDTLAPLITQMLADPKMAAGRPTDPLRFGQEDLLERELSYGHSLYQLQFMLDQSASDEDRYPLKLSQLIVTDLDTDVCHEKYTWCSDPDKAWDSTVPCVGFNGDRYYRPMSKIGEQVSYQGKVLAVDPSGRGADETGVAVVGHYGGQMFVLESKGLAGGFETEVLEEIARMALRQKVNLILVEENFGQGMFAALLKPILQKIYPCGIEETRHSIQKERRIIDTLEPVCNARKLIVDKQLVIDDYNSTRDRSGDQAQRYQLMYQFSRITRVKGSLRHDDRLDALQMAVGYWVDAMAKDTDVQIRQAAESRREKALETFMEHTVGHTPSRTSWIQPRP